MQANPLAGLDRPPSSEDMATLSVKHHHHRFSSPQPIPLSPWTVWLPMALILLTSFGAVLLTVHQAPLPTPILAQHSYHVLVHQPDPGLVRFLEEEMARGKKVRLISSQPLPDPDTPLPFLRIAPDTTITPGVLLDATVWVPEKRWKMIRPGQE